MENPIDKTIRTDDGFTFTVVDVCESEFGTDYVVRADAEGRDMAFSDGAEGIDWEYVYIPEAEATFIQ